MNQETEDIKKPEKKEHSFSLAFLICRRTIQTVLIVIIITLASLFALWALLQKGPLDLSFAKNEIETRVNAQLEDYQVDIGTPKLTWPNILMPFMVTTEEAKIFQNDQEVFSIQNIDVAVNVLPLLQQEFSPSYIRLDSPTFRLSFNEDGIDLCCDEVEIKEVEEIESQESLAEEVEEDIEIEKLQDNFVEEAEDVVRQTRLNFRKYLRQAANEELTGPFKILNDLKQLEVKDAALFLEKEGMEIDLGRFDISLKENQANINGQFSAFLPQDEEEEAKISSFVDYRSLQDDLTFTATITKLSSHYINQFLGEGHILAKQDYSVNGDAKIAFDKDFNISSALLALSSENITLDLPETLNQKLSINNVAIHAFLNNPENILEIRNIGASINDVPLTISGKGTIDNHKIMLPIESKISEADIQKISELIPDTDKRLSPQGWIKYRIQKAILKDVLVNGDLSIDLAQAAQSVNFQNIGAEFSFEDATIAFSDTLKPASNAKGSGRYKDDKLFITADTGRVGEVIASSVTVDMQDMSVVGGGTADIQIKASGPVKSALDFISDEPINFGKNIPFDRNQVEGSVDADIRVQFPTVKGLKAEDFKVTINGIINNAVVPQLIQGMDLAGGPFTLDYSDNIAKLTGDGILSTQPISFEWQKNLKSGTRDFDTKIKADLTVDQTIREAFGIDLEKYISGSLPITLDFNDKGQEAIFNVKGRLKNLEINIDEFNYSKAADLDGDISFDGLIDGEDLKEIDNLSLQTFGLDLNNGRLLFEKINGKTDVSRGEIPSVKLGQSDISVGFEITGNNILKAIATGDTFDLNSVIKPKTTTTNVITESARPQLISLDTTTMRMQNDVIAQNPKIYIETNTQGQPRRLEMDANIGSGATIVRFKPEGDLAQRRLFVEAFDAGEFLRGAGFYKNALGGYLKIDGAPDPQTGHLNGTAYIENFKVQDAPVLAKLVNSLSLPGILGLLNDEGLAFTRLESQIELRVRPEGDLIVIDDGRTTGSSLGLTFGGIIDRAENQIDISGTAIPVSQLNNIVGNIPIIGDILTGGGALVAATYTIKGPIDDPTVTVNPLSVLAPGILRRILFEEEVETKVKKAE
ncbi:MAG: AsmA-like C-terminal domain-containing protein [Pseudomonadota bacterium]